MEKKIPFAPNVILIDASYLNRVGKELSSHFSPIVHRELPKADLATLLECLALDAGLQPGDNHIQVIFIYDSAEACMDFCTPSGLERELDGVAFKSRLGEFSLYSFQPSGMVTREDLFVEAFQLAGESKAASHVVFIPDEDAYGTKMEECVRQIKGKESLTLFGMNPPSYEGEYSFELLGFSILQALGIRSDEL